jgi:glucose-6-phosphate isomerase
MVVLSLFHDVSASNRHYEQFKKDDVVAKLKYLDVRTRRKGLDELDPSRNALIGLGMEIGAAGKVTKNSYGVFHLAWRAQEDGDWHRRVIEELEEIRARIRAAHRTPLRFLIWAGMGGSAEDKAMYQAAGLLRRGPRVYVLDSTDPAKLKAILADIESRSKGSLANALKATLVVGMAMGMTSYEPVVNLEKLHGLYQNCGIDSRPNFVYMTLPGSLLDQFASARGYRRVELQLDNGNATAGRHSGPLTRGSLYPLGLAGVDLKAWIEATYLDEEQVAAALRLAAFLHAHGEQGRDKVTLMLPGSWEGASLWTKQDFEESLGKSEQAGIKIVIGEKVKLANYRSPKDAAQDRVFLAIRRKGEAADGERVALLRRTGYAGAVLTFGARERLSTYMQFIHYVVFGLGYLRNMNFVTQPSVELYKAITNQLHADAERAGGIRNTEAWKRFEGAGVKYRGGVTLHAPFIETRETTGSAPAVYARLLKEAAQSRRIDTAELTFFGDMRYAPKGKAVRKRMDRAAELVFRSKLKLPVDIYEGPAMNHSYHEMIIGHGRCFSTVILADRMESIKAVGYTPEYHTAQFLATQMALAQRGRMVVALKLKDLETATMDALDEFFRQVALLV